MTAVDRTDFWDPFDKINALLGPNGGLCAWVTYDDAGTPHPYCTSRHRASRPGAKNDVVELVTELAMLQSAIDGIVVRLAESVGVPADTLRGMVDAVKPVVVGKMDSVSRSRTPPPE